VRRGTDSSSIRFGYQSNQAGFGWTNAVYTRLLDEMSTRKQ
jgi:neutral trehalase